MHREGSGSAPDAWAAWLLETRHGGDPDQLHKMLPALFEFRDTVIGHADIRPGDVVLDAGCGDGLLGFRALDKVGDAGKVAFVDVSPDLLERCREIAGGLQVAERCRFVRTGFPDLREVEDGSVDVAMTRSVLIYVDDKLGAFEALHRVLRPGGRLSIFEPINSFCWPEPEDRLWGFEITGLEPLAEKVKQRVGDVGSAPASMVDFDERGLLALAERAGFAELHMDFHAEIKSGQPDDWDSILRSVPNPLSPPLGEILATALTSVEYAAVAARIQEQIAAGQRQERGAITYLWATRR